MPSTTIADTSDSAGGKAQRVRKTMRFRRGRATKACEVCHARKVRCDMTENFPCTNCRAFSLVCIPREGRGKGRRSEPEESGNGTPAQPLTSPDEKTSSIYTPQSGTNSGVGAYVYYPENAHPNLSCGESRFRASATSAFKQSSKFLQSWRGGTNSSGEKSEDDQIVSILKRGLEKGVFPRHEADEICVRAQGAFLLPSTELQDHLIDLYFKYVHPFIPVINRNEFMKEYRENRDKPSLMVRQAIFCVSSRLSDHPDLCSLSGSSGRSAIIFYRRAKALFDVRFDGSIESSITTAIILSLAVDNPLHMDQNGYYWVRVALAQANGIGLHRKLRDDELSPSQRSRWRRIWWTLYKRDISTAMSYGRPVAINLEDCDVEMVSAEDFIESEGPVIESGSDIEVNISYFIFSVWLHEILALVMRIQFTVGAERLRRLHLLPDVTQCDHALAEWISQIPAILKYSIKDDSRHQFIRALLYLEYYTVVCLSHRPQVSHLFKVDGWRQFPTWSIAFQAAHMISKILENFGRHGELRRLPAFAVYSCFSALIMISFQRRVSREQDEAVLAAVRAGLTSFQKILTELAKSHATGAWILQLANELQREDGAKKLAKTFSMPTKAYRRKPSGDAPNMKESLGLTLATGFPHSPATTAPVTSFEDFNVTERVAVRKRKLHEVPRSTRMRLRRETLPNGQGAVRDYPQASSHSNKGLLGTDKTPQETSEKASEQGPTGHNSSSQNSSEIFTPSGVTFSAGDLFPADIEFPEFSIDPLNAASSTASSGDETIPESLNMVDWYDFLNTETPLEQDGLKCTNEI